MRRGGCLARKMPNTYLKNTAPAASSNKQLTCYQCHDYQLFCRGPKDIQNCIRTALFTPLSNKAIIHPTRQTRDWKIR